MWVVFKSGQNGRVDRWTDGESGQSGQSGQIYKVGRVGKYRQSETKWIWTDPIHHLSQKKFSHFPAYPFPHAYIPFHDVLPFRLYASPRMTF